MLVFNGVGMHHLTFFSLCFVVAEFEIQYSNAINSLEVIVPVTFYCLPAYGESRIIYGALHKIVLLCLLHFYYKLFAPVIFAVYIINGLAFVYNFRKLLGIFECQVFYMRIWQQGVEEIYQKVFVRFFPKDFLKPIVCEYVDIFCHDGCFLHPQN